MKRPEFNWRKLCRLLSLKYPDRATLPVALVSVARQRMYLVDNMRLRTDYPVSTSRFGVGTRVHSFRTPSGAHRVAWKFGGGAAPGRIFKGRRDTGKTAVPGSPVDGDVVCTRILWLDGLEAGHNRGATCDSYRRYIYIHGTMDEWRIGRPASHGCIRMRNDDVCEAYDILEEESLVYVLAQRGGTGDGPA